MTHDNQPQTLPEGDIHFDGRHLSVGGVQLAPGRYALSGSDAVLEVAELDDAPESAS